MLLIAVLMCMSVPCTIFALTQGRTLDNCDNIDTWKYTRTDVETVDTRILDVAVSPHTGNIYLAVQNNDFIVMKKGAQETTKEIILLDGYLNSIAVDSTTPKVYLATNIVLKTYNEITGTFGNILPIMYNIAKLFAPKNKKELYGVKHSEHELYQYESMLTEEVKLNIQIQGDWVKHRFVVDHEGHIFYTTEENKHVVTRTQLKGQRTTIIYTDGPFYALAIDNMGRTFGTKDRRVYYLQANGSRPKLVTTLDFNPEALCFDKDNNAIFATEEKKIVMFKFDSICSYLSTSELNNMSDVIISINRNISMEFENIKRQLDKTTSVITQIESIRETLNRTSNKYDNLELNIENMAGRIKTLEEKKLKTEVAGIENLIHHFVGSEVEGNDTRYQTDNKTEKLGNGGIFVYYGTFNNTTYVFNK